MAQTLPEKYALERSKRLRADGVAQYIDARSKEIQDLARDPWVDYGSQAIKTPPLKDGSSIKFLVCGGGHSGILYAYRLIEAGFSNKDIVVVDIAGGFGGTWYWNRYPGLMCDVEGFIYLPLLEETGYVPKHKYSYGDEIRGQSERIAAKWGLQGQFATKVDSQTWDEARHQWVVKLTRTVSADLRTEQLTVYADFVVGAGGVLSVPKVPKLKGWSEFRANKHAFHTSRWDYAYTGGSQEKPDMTKLQGKRVAIIGTGATAVQVIPELAKWAEHLYVVQRTPSYCGPRGQVEVTPELWSKVADGPGWQNRRRLNFNSYVSDNPELVNLVDDGWTHTPGVCGTIGSASRVVSPDKIGDHSQELLKVDAIATGKFRARISEIVKDPVTAEKLKPWYGTWCKRPTFHDVYLPTFNRDNVTLIDTNGKGLESLSGKGLVVDGVEYNVDCLVLATGFVVGTDTDLSKKIDAPITGRNGDFRTAWQKPGASTAFGVFIPGFPNFGATLYRGGGFSYNLSSVYDVFARLFAQVMVTVHSQKNNDQEKVIFDVTEEALERWAGEVAARGAWFAGLSICTPGYYTDEGDTFGKEGSAKVDDDEAKYARARQALWGSGPVDYQLRMENYVAKESNILEDFTIDVV